MASPTDRSRITTPLALGVLAALLAACDSQPTAVVVPERELAGLPMQHATPIDYTELEKWTPPYETLADGSRVYLLPKACDVLIGQEILPLADMPRRFAHQLLVDVPVGATIKLVDAGAEPYRSMPGFFPPYPNNSSDETKPTQITHDPVNTIDGGYRVFQCSAEDPENPGRPVVEPVTDHAGKGDGPQIHIDGVTLDLNGHGMFASPSATDLDPAYDNIGVVIGGSGVTLTNSAPIGTASKAGVAFITGFGHNIDIEADNAKVLGSRTGSDVDATYGIETTGGLGARLSSGTLVIDKVKSVDMGPIGQGFEIRRCVAGSTSTISDSHLVGFAEGAFIRECAGVTLQGNYISAPGGIGIATREAAGTTSFPNRLLGNTLRNATNTNAENGIVLESRSVNFVIRGNVVDGFHCGIQLFQAGAAQLLASEQDSRKDLTEENTLNTSPRVCGADFIAPTNPPPVADFSFACAGLGCTLTDLSTDLTADEQPGTIATWSWSFGSGATPSSATTKGPHPVTYPAGGTYTVTLLVTDTQGGVGEVSKTITVTPPTNVPPTSSFQASDCTADGTFTCTFGEASSDASPGVVTGWRWSHGDGTTTSWTIETRPSAGVRTHAYAGVGFYTVELLVTDDEGATGSSTRQVVVVGPITITQATTVTRKGRRELDLRWAGALGDPEAGDAVSIERRGTGGVVSSIQATNTGRWRGTLPTGTDAVRVCNLVDATGPVGTVCSDWRAVTGF